MPITRSHQLGGDYVETQILLKFIYLYYIIIKLKNKYKKINK